ncbi:hypothetical protein [Aggregatibacter actinomycetemcomitans]|uniref:hypothetical protein n=1 Tax=Aggregatibacter actinomycetemcomitans TaxID=714 RepID=UPI0006A6ADE8|nr:hypothetical protein [Aggregatibacter actinomycetemcomitans]KOE58096.1 membrane protein [Aggregatibacter actinomycetemcomitans serotype c str. AAS4A]KOE60538.1 membrane protein [Aggregatibacter actinomycetemcomitans serotype c str. SCC2302]
MVIGVSKVEDKKDYFLSLLKENINVGVFLIFVLEIYSFSFLIEFIMIPFSTFLFLYIKCNSLNENNKKISCFIYIILSLWIVIYFLHSIYLSVLLFDANSLWGNILELFLPSILSLICIPFLYFLSIYMEYERVFASLKIYFNDNGLFEYAKKLSLKYFKFNVDYLRRWNRNIRIYQIRDKEDLERSVCNIKKLKGVESNPPFVPSKKGWSPYLARNFLKNDKIIMTDYHPGYDNRWWAYSRPLLIDQENSFSDMITYYIYGDEKIVGNLKLKVYINNVSISESTKEVILKVFSGLLLNSIKCDSIKINNWLKKTPFSMEKDNYIISFTKENFTNNRGYTLELNISIKLE